MTINVPQRAYTVSSGTANINGYKLVNRDPGTADVAYPLKQLWINTLTNANWQLVAFTSSVGVVSATWRSIAPVVVTSTSPASTDYLYPVGQLWANTTAFNTYLMTYYPTSTTANWVPLSINALPAIFQITPDAGTNPVVPTAAGVVTMGLGQAAGIITTGGTNQLNISTNFATTNTTTGALTFYDPKTIAAFFVYTSSQILGAFALQTLTNSLSFAGGIVALTVANTSIAANSHSAVGMTVANSTSNMYVSYNNTGASQTWVHGMNGGVSNQFQLSASNTLGTANVFTVTTTGLASFPNANGSTAALIVGGTALVNSEAFLVTGIGSGVGGTLMASVRASGTSQPILSIISGGAAVSPIIQLGPNGASQWVLACNASATNSFQLINGNNIGGTVVLAASTANAITFNGAYTFPKTDGISGQQLTTNGAGTVTWSNPTTSQLLVFAYLITSMTNQTGDNTNATVIFDTASVNVGTAYNVATGVFTAPATGHYNFEASILISPIAVNHTLSSVFVLNGINITIQSGILNPASCRSSSNYMSLNISGTIPLTSGDLVKMQVNIQGGAKTVGFLGSASQFFTYQSITRVS